MSWCGFTKHQLLPFIEPVDILSFFISALRNIHLGGKGRYRFGAGDIKTVFLEKLSEFLQRASVGSKGPQKKKYQVMKSEPCCPVSLVSLPFSGVLKRTPLCRSANNWSFEPAVPWALLLWKRHQKQKLCRKFPPNRHQCVQKLLGQLGILKGYVGKFVGRLRRFKEIVNLKTNRRTQGIESHSVFSTIIHRFSARYRSFRDSFQRELANFTFPKFGYNIESPFNRNWRMGVTTNEMVWLPNNSSVFYDGIDFAVWRSSLQDPTYRTCGQECREG